MTAKSKYPIWSSETRARPHALYKQMREQDPIYNVMDGMGQNVWFFTRYHDTVAVLKDPRFMKNWMTNRDGIDPDDFHPIWGQVEMHLLNQDPPNHTRLRALVHKAFTPRAVRELQPRIQEVADDLLDNMAAANETDLIESFALLLPIVVISEMLGIPATDRDNFRKWSQILIGDDNESKPATIMQFAEYMTEKIEERRANPTDDILSGLVNAEEAGDTLNRGELLSMIILLIVAGHETTVNLIGNGMLTLFEHPEQLQLLKNNPDHIKTAIEEMLRFNGPVDATTFRFAAEDVEWDGHKIKKHDVIHPLLLAANRDADVFENPDTFDITRDPNPHVAFGHGIHYCVGAPLARMEGAIAINSLLARFPDIRLNANPDTLEWGNILLLHGLKALPVKY